MDPVQIHTHTKQEQSHAKLLLVMCHCLPFLQRTSSTLQSHVHSHLISFPHARTHTQQHFYFYHSAHSPTHNRKTPKKLDLWHLLKPTKEIHNVTVKLSVSAVWLMPLAHCCYQWAPGKPLRSKEMLPELLFLKLLHISCLEMQKEAPVHSHSNTIQH